MFSPLCMHIFIGKTCFISYYIAFCSVQNRKYVNTIIQHILSNVQYQKTKFEIHLIKLSKLPRAPWEAGKKEKRCMYVLNLSQPIKGLAFNEI